jgi:hypothetical protein
MRRFTANSARHAIKAQRRISRLSSTGALRLADQHRRRPALQRTTREEAIT